MPTFVTPEKTAVDGAFAEFFALEKIKLIGQCPNFERAVFSSRAPPKLKVLAASCYRPLRGVETASDAQHALDFAPFFRAPSCSKPDGLERLELTHTDRSHQDRDSYLALARELNDVGVELLVYAEKITTFFPPYLDGEPRPEVNLYFDGEAITPDYA